MILNGEGWHYLAVKKLRTFVKSYGLLSFAKNLSKNIGKNISKNLSGRYSPGMLVTRQKLLDHAKQFATDALKTASKKSNNSKNSRGNW